MVFLLVLLYSIRTVKLHTTHAFSNSTITIIKRQGSEGWCKTATAIHVEQSTAS